MVPLIVGFAFFAFGSLFLYIRMVFESEAKVVSGTVVGLERKISHMGSGQSRRRSVLYRPLVEYAFKGQNYRFTPDSSSSNGIFKYKIGQKVKLLSLDKGAEYVLLKEGSLKMISVLFILIGLGVMGVGINLLRDFDFTNPFDYLFHLLPLASILIFLLMAKMKMGKRKRGLKEKGIEGQMLKSATLETEASLKGRTIYWSNHEIKKELGKVNKLGAFVTFIFLSFSLLFTAHMYKRMQGSARETLLAFMSDLSQLDGVIELLKAENPEVIGFLAGLVFTLLCLLGLIQQKRASIH